MFTTNSKGVLSPEEVKDLLLIPFETSSIAAQVATIHYTGANETRFPIIEKDPTAEWTAEGEEITPSDAVVAEVTVTPDKVAGLTVCSNELMADGLTAAIEQVGTGLVRQMINAVDNALFATESIPNAPQGLGTAKGINEIAGDLTNLDAFMDAVANSRNNGAEVTNFVANPEDVLTLSKLKESTSSQRGLLQPDPTQPNIALIDGRPILTCKHIAKGTIWAIPQTAIQLVVREDAKVESDTSPFFSSDQTAIRAKMRVAFAITHPATISKITISE